MAQKKKKKKKKGHVAIPFLLTLLLGIVGIGGVAIYFFDMIGINKEHIVEWNSTVKTPTAEDNMTILFVLDEPDDSSPLTILMARLLPADKKIVFLSYPVNMLSVVEGRSDTLAGFYSSGGIKDLEAAIENEAGIATDRYVILDSEGFQKICNIMGGVYYLAPSGIKGFADSNAPQYLGPHQIEKLVTYPFFEKGDIERSAITADVITEMCNVSDADRERLLASMDSNFKTVINMIDTDITSMDYNDHKNALKYMWTYGKEIASFRIITGTPGEEEDIFLLSDTFYSSVEEFFTQPPEVKPVQEDAQ